MQDSFNVFYIQEILHFLLHKTRHFSTKVYKMEKDSNQFTAE